MTDHIMQGEDNSDLFAELFADEDEQESNKLLSVVKAWVRLFERD